MVTSISVAEHRQRGLLNRMIDASTALRRGALLLLTVLALATAACSAPADSGGSTGDALGFSGQTLDDAELDASTLNGTPVVLWFWAPWCTVCRAEAPDVAAVAAEFEGRVTLLGIPGRGEVDAMRAFVSETGTDGFTHIVDADGTLWTRFGVVSQPAFVFIDSAGASTSFSGSLNAEDLRAAFDDLV